MRPSLLADWREHYVLTSEITLPGQRAAFYREAARGRWVRVRPGAFFAAAAWDDLDLEQRHLARARATALLEPAAVFSHLTASLIWSLPLVDPPPPLPHVRVARAAGGRSSTSVTRFALGSVPPAEVDGLQVTDLATTVLDVAASFEAETSVPILDAAAAGRARDGVALDAGFLEAAAETPAGRASQRQAFALRFADAASGSAGESLSRVAIHRAGLPAPVLQQRFDDAAGLAGIVDFWWPEAGVIGEFDGVGKYLRDLSGRGRDTAQIVIDEKRREDRLRALGFRVVRWGWRAARSRGELRSLLIRSGLRADQLRSRR